MRIVGEVAMHKQRPAGKLLRLLAQLIDRLDEQELDSLIEGTAELAVHPKEKQTGRRAVINRRKDFARPEIEEIGKELRKLRSRELGEQFLQRQQLSRKELEELARYLELPVETKDSVERLKGKVIEGTIGFRLRSEAIRGERV